MKKYEYIEKYGFDKILPLEKIQDEVSHIEGSGVFKKRLVLITAISLIIGGLISVFAIISVFLIKAVFNSEIFSPIKSMYGFIPIFIGVLLLIVYQLLRFKTMKEIDKVPIVQDLINKGSAFYYNHMLKQMPELAGIEVKSGSESFISNFNPKFAASVKNFSLEAQQVAGGHLIFMFKNQEFILTNEFVGERRVKKNNSNGKSNGEEVYYTFITALVSTKLVRHSSPIYCMNNKKIPFKPAGFKKFESESIEFNESFNTYYTGEDVTIFQKFNPVVLDKFNNINHKHFGITYGNDSGIITYSSRELPRGLQTNINSIYPIRSTGKKFLVDLDETFKRFEGNLKVLLEKLNFILPLLD